jgi:hypothetical protein
MWNEPTKEKLATIPKFYETEKIPLKDKKIHLHFFIFDCDWYIAEYDGEETFFGFVILGNDYHNAEWGYVNFNDLKNICLIGTEVDSETPWRICKASEIEKICKAQDWTSIPMRC